MNNARPCTYCAAPYIEPCDGKNPACGNKPLADARRAAKAKERESKDEGSPGAD